MECLGMGFNETICSMGLCPPLYHRERERLFKDHPKSLSFIALHMAAANGHLDIVEYLIGRGVDVNASNVENNTPLHWACLNGHVEVVKKLVSAGANVSLLNSHERTPIDEAVSMGKVDVIDAINATMAELELTALVNEQQLGVLIFLGSIGNNCSGVERPIFVVEVDILLSCGKHS
ncbi:hypothetical protein GOBAR_DD36379 [Gossypium barbadense]|nr:hypothetical protein GOBAR_DD36379 [Gossypium barbadense]